jgi:NodT family efflux transporter outer membrane factor (OMF) lipoprotein
MKRALFILLVLGCVGCTVGPDYRRPAADVPAHYKELAGWTIASPQDAATARGAWWRIYNDPQLDNLESQVAVSNQTIKQYEAQYRAAVALVHQAQAGYFPTVGANAGVTRSASGSATSGRSRTSTQYTLEGTADWSPDLWGRIRREVESARAAAEVSAADLANARLSAEATLATDYIDLRAEDSLTKVLQDTVDAYAAALRIAQNQYHAGTVSDADMVTAEAQLQSVTAQLAGVAAQRALYEHAIAMLTGHAPSEISIGFSPLPMAVPVLPPGLPSTLLQRRPDIAAAERAMQEENALIGEAQAAYYPTISLSALAGFAGNPLGSLFNVANRVWSLGAAADETLFEGGLRSAQVEQARANYDGAVATYRQTVLVAFQQVEDELSSLRVYAGQAAAEDAAIRATQRAVEVALNEYRAGTVPYTSVITEQELLLSDQQSAVAIQQSRLVASIALIEALGGGWNTSDLPPMNQPATAAIAAP